MKRSEKWRKHQRRRQRREAYAKARFKKYKKQKNFHENHLRKEHKKAERRKSNAPRKPKVVVAPEDLSFIADPEGVSRFVKELEVCHEQRKPVWVQLKDIRFIDYGGINVLLSVVVIFKSRRIWFNGDYPENPEISKILGDSGFFEHLYSGEFKDDEAYSLKRSGIIQTHAKKKVDSVLGEKLISAGSRHVWGEARRCPGVQRTFIELMQNTNNHASLEKHGEKHWWLSMQFDSDRGVVCFSFVDYGVGVFENLSRKSEGNKFFRMLDALRERVELGSNAEILKLILSGDLHRTATKKPFRGKGLPGIYEALKSNMISRLVIVTNDVFYNSANERARTLKVPFSGTFVYWELSAENHNLPKI